MVWLKRVLPLVILLAVWFGWNYWQDRQLRAERDRVERLVTTMAKIWVATASYREDPEGFTAYRDSVMEADGVDSLEYFTYLEEYREEPERLKPFIDRMRAVVDSLYTIEDSLLRVLDSLAIDSVTDTLTLQQ